MGKMRMGILDGFIGKVGTVVGSFWKGKKVLRGYNEFPSNPDTETQRLQRAKFGLLGEMGGAVLNALRVGLKVRADSRKSTEVGEFVRLNMDKVSGTVEHLAVAYDGIQLSDGNLTTVGFDEPDLENPLVVKVSITESYLTAPDAHADDKVYLVIYNKTLGKGVVTDGMAKRSDSQIEVTVPGNWQGTQVEIWGFVQAHDGAATPGVCSATTYLGAGTIA